MSIMVSTSYQQWRAMTYTLHTGNGIQKAFYDDPNVLYISLHVYQDGRFYPGGDEGDLEHCGSGSGVGRYVTGQSVTRHF